MIHSVSFIGVFFIGIAMDLACGPEPDPYDYYISFFHNNIQKHNEFWPFYFNGYTFLNDDQNVVSEQGVNSREWANYLGNSVKQNDVERAMYNLTDSVESTLFNRYLIYAKLPDSLKNNTFLKNLVSQSRKPALRYYLFSEGLEHITKNRGDRWDPQPLDSVALNKKAKDAWILADKEKESFLKLRYYYQTQRLFHYSNNSNAALNIYQEHIAKIQSNSHIKGWALSLKAGEEQKLGHKQQAAYLFSKVFAICPERRVQAYISFNGLKVPEEKVIRLAKNNTEKGFIYAINGFHDRHIGLGALKKVYSVDPKSSLVSVLLVREINKIEEGYLTSKINGNIYYDSIGYYDHDKYDSTKVVFGNYITTLKDFCKRLAVEHKCAEPELGYLASAYLSWVQGNPQEGFAAMEALKDKRIRVRLFDEKQMITLLLISQSIKKLDNAAESRLLPLLKWLEKKVKQEALSKTTGTTYWSDYDRKYYSASSRDFYAKVLARLYFEQKDTVMAALCILKSEKTISTSTVWNTEPEHGLGFQMPYFWQTSLHSYHLKKILDWELASIKNPYLRLLMKEFRQPVIKKIIVEEHPPGKTYYYLKKTVLKATESTLVPGTYDLLGTAYLREQKYSEAVKAFKHIDIAKLERSTSDAYSDSLSKHYNIYANPFVDKLHDYPLSYSLKKNVGYSKLAYAQTMARLQRLIKRHPKIAGTCYYKMANGLYNTSFYGNAWYYTSYNWAGNDRTRINGFYYDNNYLRAKTAETYFLRAGRLSNNREFKARCTFMAAKCRQKQTIYPQYDYMHYEKSKAAEAQYKRSLRKNPYFAELQKNYANTSFYKLAVTDCSYLRDFLNGR